MMNLTWRCSQDTHLSKTVPHDYQLAISREIASSQGGLLFEWSHICDRARNPVKVALQEGTTGKKRGPQKPRIRSVEDMILTSMSSEYVELKGEMFVKLVSGNSLPKAWEDLYQ